FKFTTAGGAVSFTGNVAAFAAMLDLKLELRNSSGNLIATSDTATLGETLTANVGAGTYYLVVASHGAYGDVGQYSVSGSVTAVEGTVAAPSGLVASVTTGQVGLSWLDQSDNETGFVLQRSMNGGVSWDVMTTLGANAISYLDTSITSGMTYDYRLY